MDARTRSPRTPSARRASSSAICGTPAHGTLLRRYRNGDAGVEGYAEDYAYLVFGLLELFQATGEPRGSSGRWRCRRGMDELFWDPSTAAGSARPGDDPSVLLRLKETYDGAEPAASSIAVLNLLTLSHLTGDGAR